MNVDLIVVRDRCHELLEQIHGNQAEASKLEFDRILKEMQDDGEDSSFILRHCIDFLHHEAVRNVVVVYGLSKSLAA